MPTIAVQFIYTYESSKLPSVSDTARALKFGINTILRTPRQSTSDQVVLDDVALICELDEQWLFTGD